MYAVTTNHDSATDVPITNEQLERHDAVVKLHAIVAGLTAHEARGQAGHITHKN